MYLETKFVDEYGVMILMYNSATDNYTIMMNDSHTEDLFVLMREGITTAFTPKRFLVAEQFVKTVKNFENKFGK